MNGNNMARLSRLTAIVTLLQTKRILTATNLAEKFNVSVRTIYRDIKSLEQSGIPIFTEEGRGYSLVEGYTVPPVMFTEHEANALITVEQLMLKSQDSSLSREFVSAINKVKAVLQCSAKNKAELLSNRIVMSPMIRTSNPSESLMVIQSALISFHVLEIVYRSQNGDEETLRRVEPFALYYSLEKNWLLIAYCRLRKDFRMFRLDRILTIKLLQLSFAPHALNLTSYLASKEKNFATPDIPLS